MLYNLTRTAIRRVITPNIASRALLARSFSLTPALSAATEKAAAKTTSRTSKPKSVAKTKAKPKTTPGRSKKTKKAKKDEKPKISQKDLKVPKRPGASPYVMFFKQQFRKAEASSIAASQAQTKQIAEKWHTLSEEEKAQYQKDADEHNAILAKKWDEWLTTTRPEVLHAINKKQKDKGKLKLKIPRTSPARPLNGFFRFHVEYMKQHPDLLSEGVTVVTSAAAKAYRELPEAERKVYTDAYAEELKAWHAEKQKLSTQQNAQSS